MKNSGIKSQDTEAFGKILQAMLLTAFSPDNFEPFLKKMGESLSGPGGFGSRAKIAILFESGKCSARKPFFKKFTKAEKALLLAGKKHVPAAKGRTFAAEIMVSNSKAGRITVFLAKPPANPSLAHGMVDMAAKVLGARLLGEKRDTELNFERDLSAAVKHVEELYLAFPGISIEEISRAVLDEARRITGSSLGLAGCMDHASGEFRISAMTKEAVSGRLADRRALSLKKFPGLLGWVLKREKHILTNAAKSDRRAAGLPEGHASVHKFLGVPAMSGRKLLGMLALANPHEPYGPEALDAAQKLARVYAMILQRKISDDRRREEDERFRTIISSSKDVIFTVDLEGRVTYVSPRVEDYGYTQQELLGRPIAELSHPEDRDFLVKAFANAIKTGRTLPIIPYRVKKKDGTYFYSEQKSGIVYVNGRPAYVTGVMRDVTEQKRTEIRLKESEELMRMVFETAKDAIFIKDMNGMYVKANNSCAELLGTTAEGLIGHTDSEYLPSEAARRVFVTDSEVVRTGKTLSLINFHPFPTGSRHINIIKTPLRNVKGEIIGLLGIARDITALKRAEAELALARASQAVSDVARPMAHDFNNALAAINGYATLIDDELSDSSPIKTEISQIIKAVKRAAELTSKFQAFARNPKIDEKGGGDAQ